MSLNVFACSCAIWCAALALPPPRAAPPRPGVASTLGHSGPVIPLTRSNVLMFTLLAPMVPPEYESDYESNYPVAGQFVNPILNQIVG